MTVAEWEASTTQPVQMLRKIRDRLTPRTRQLIACAICRLIPFENYEPWMQKAIRAAEEFAEEQIGAKRFNDERTAILSKARRHTPKAPTDFRMAMILDMYNSSNLFETFPQLLQKCAECYPRSRKKIIHAQCDLIRDLVNIGGRPLRGSPSEAANQIAEAIEHDQSFENLPILADAMEDAGCTDDRILKHLRARKPHYRGCWALESILRKTHAEAPHSGSRAGTSSRFAAKSLHDAAN